MIGYHALHDSQATRSRDAGSLTALYLSTSGSTTTRRTRGHLPQHPTLTPTQTLTLTLLTLP
eukprot:scaffold83530_cov58-Phaeocystis_antarctica.AAC.3